jgi:DNA-binding Xre family transcriptional regulator
MERGDPVFLSARAKRIRRALAQKGWTQKHLANKTGWCERTLRNLLDGRRVRAQVVEDVCEALGVEPGREHATQIAGEEYGAYPRSAVRIYEGGWFAYRWSFTPPPRMM